MEAKFKAHEQRLLKIKQIMNTPEMRSLCETKFQNGFAFHIHDSLHRKRVIGPIKGPIILDDDTLDRFLKNPSSMVELLGPWR